MLTDSLADSLLDCLLDFPPDSFLDSLLDSRFFVFIDPVLVKRCVSFRVSVLFRFIKFAEHVIWYTREG